MTEGDDQQAVLNRRLAALLPPDAKSAIDYGFDRSYARPGGSA